MMKGQRECRFAFSRPVYWSVLIVVVTLVGVMSGCGSGTEYRWSGVECANTMNAVEAGETIEIESESLPTPCSAWLTMQQYSFTLTAGNKVTQLKGPAKPMFGWTKVGGDCPVKACGSKPLQNQISHVEKWEVIDRGSFYVSYIGEDSRGTFQHIDVDTETGLPMMALTTRAKTTDDILYFAAYSDFQLTR